VADREAIKMNDVPRSALGRRALLLMPLALSGCSLWDDWFGSEKTPIPDKRIAVMSARTGLDITTANVRPVTLPPAAANADWPQAGGLPSHDMEHPALATTASRAWTADVGTGGGYRRKLTAQPVIAGGRVFTMDSDGRVSAFDAATGRREWDLDTQSDDNRSTNIGGGIAVDGAVVYAATGRGDVAAIATTTGKIVWHRDIGEACRSAPTIAEGRLYIPTLTNKLLALATTDGKQVWSYQATNAETMVLGLPSPAYADGLVVAGFGAGDLVALRAASGTVAWADSLASSRGRTSLVDLSTIRARPVIKNGTVYAVGIGGLLLALDLRSGRRLWERDVASYDMPWVAGNWIFLLSQGGQLAALSTIDGTPSWVRQLDRFEDMEKQRDPILWVGPVLAGGRLVVAGSNSVQLSVNPTTGVIIGHQTLPDAASLTPSIAGGTLYVLTDDGTLTAFR